MVWLSAFHRAANEITDANPPFAGTRAPHLRNVSAESARAAVSANTGSGDAGRRFSPPVLRATQGSQPSHSLSGSTSSPRTHYISSLINTAPQATAPGPSIAANIARSASIFRGFQPMSEARANEGREGRKGISGSGLLERHWRFPAVARAIKRSEVSSTLLKAEVTRIPSRTPVITQGNLSYISRAPGIAPTNQRVSQGSEAVRSPLLVQPARREETAGRPSFGQPVVSIAEGFRTSERVYPVRDEPLRPAQRTPVEPAILRSLPSRTGISQALSARSEQSQTSAYPPSGKMSAVTRPNLGITSETRPVPGQNSARGNSSPSIPRLSNANHLGPGILKRHEGFGPLERAAQFIPQAISSNAVVAASGTLPLDSPISLARAVQRRATAATITTRPNPDPAPANSTFGYVPARSSNPQLPAIDRIPPYSTETALGRSPNTPLPRAFPPEPAVLNRAFSSGSSPSLAHPDLPLVGVSGAGITRREAARNQVPAPSAGPAGTLLLQRASTRAAAAMTETAQATTPAEQPTGGEPPAPPTAPSPEGVDLEHLADQVYTIIERRLTLERESLGL
jgi:hypothetical protein